MRRATTIFAVLCAAVTVWSCKERSPEEKVAQARARYTVTLNGFFEKEEPMAEPAAIEEAAVAMEEVAAEAAAAEGGEEGEETDLMDEEEEMAGPKPVDVLLDLIVQHDLDTALPGVTIDLIMVDADRKEKGAWKIWVDTEGLPEANQKQVTHILEDVYYEDGDGFSVELRSNIPPEERGDYREFAAAAP